MSESDPQLDGGSRSTPEDTDGPRVSTIYVEGKEFFVVSLARRDVRYPESTTQAERAIVDLLLGGHTLTEVATVRRTSLKTVRTQLALIYRKAGVHSVRELAAFATGLNGPWAP